MAAIDDLKEASDNLAAAIKAATVSPKPNYSVDGQSVSWGDYLAMLIAQKKSLDAAIAQSEPFEFATEAY